MERVYIGLGSNLDNPLQHVQTAIAELAALPDCTLLAQSPWYGSAAVGPGEQPDYVNGVACLDTNLEPHALLDNLQAIEQSHRRVRQQHWGPRTLDLDLLLYGQQVIHTERLQVPHPWLQQRNFVVLPLADVAPELTLPDHTSLQMLAHAISREGIWRLDDMRPHLNR
jgi:2-amino-4-hydroxy-6-hydroxymethyldihydropteridine diphosphokinase